MGYWQKESEFGKKEGCFKAPLGSLGLNKEFLNKSFHFDTNNLEKNFMNFLSFSQFLSQRLPLNGQWLFRSLIGIEVFLPSLFESCFYFTGR